MALWFRIPLWTATVAAPIWKLWEEKLPSIWAEVMICLSQSVRIVRVRGCPFANKNRGPEASPLKQGMSSSRAPHREDACQGQCEQPFWDGFVVERLIGMRMDVGAKEESTSLSWTLEWMDEEYLDRLGTMNSKARRKLKYPRNKLPRTSDDLEGWDPKTAK